LLIFNSGGNSIFRCGPHQQPAKKTPREPLARIALRHQMGGQTVFVGHLAVALGAKTIEPRVSLAAAVAAAFGLDLL
jgi:hypothetical protein